jgi:F0F1-type ATP synthase membrane subunit c/vacuolar-type H+-ATPase subunit K
LGRNPSAAPKIFTAMIMMVIFGSAISIISLLVLFQVYVPKR